jgi:hypothetical protein
MSVGGDRSRRHRTSAVTRGRVLAQVSSYHPRSGPVRPELTNKSWDRYRARSWPVNSPRAGMARVAQPGFVR